jgi:hypothetical protein
MADLTKENVKEMFGGTEFKYFVAFTNLEDNEIIHMVGFMEPPAVADVVSAVEELKVDEDFGIPSDIVDQFGMRIFSFPD